MQEAQCGRGRTCARVAAGACLAGVIEAGQAGSSSGKTGVEVECDLAALVVVADVWEPAATWTRDNIFLGLH